MEIAQLQNEIRIWNTKHFPEISSNLALIKILEELGEIANHYLRRIEHRAGICATIDHTEGIKDGVADVLISLLIFCIRENIDLDEQVRNTWEEVSKRTYTLRIKDKA